MILALSLVGTLVIAAAEPIRLHPDNPHYLSFRGRPAVLITSGEHYGAVMNRDFDFIRYLDELKRHGFNLTRVFSGTYREVAGSFNIVGNTLAPTRFVCPWAREPDGKFDLKRWDESYFTRLKDFVKSAGTRGVVVELVLFCPMYDESVWQASPMHPGNNVNGVGNIGRYEVFNGKDKALFPAQKQVVRKIVNELNGFDNLYYEICNEPYERGGLTQEWNDAIITTILESEASLPAKHLIAQNFPPSDKAVAQLNPAVSVLNFHAAKIDAIRLNYGLGKVIAHDETGGSERSDRKYRTEGWEFILAGGGIYDHLDFSFTTDRPDGTAVPLPFSTPGGGGPELRRQLAILTRFIEGFDFIHMKPMDVVATQGGSPARAYGLAQAGKAYAIYLNGGTKTELEFDLSSGAYDVEWLNTKTGEIVQTERLMHNGGRRTLSSPRYVEDIAVGLRAARRASP